MESTGPNMRSYPCILNSLIVKHPQHIVLVFGTEISAVTAPGDNASESWRCYLLTIIDVAEQLEALRPACVCEFRERIKKESDLLPIACEIAAVMSQMQFHSSPLDGIKGRKAICSYFCIRILTEEVEKCGDLKTSSFHNCFNHIVECLERQITCPNVMDAILSLMEVGVKVITTNNHNFFEASCQLRKRCMQSIDLQNPTKVILWAKGLMPYAVFHMHGICNDACNIGMSPPGYEEALQNNELMDTLQRLYFTKTFVFFGCERIFCDQIFQSFFFRLSQKTHGLEHYMFCRKTDSNAFYRNRKNLLQLGVKLTSYGETFAHFQQCIKEIASLLHKEAHSGVTAERAASVLLTLDCMEVPSQVSSRIFDISRNATSSIWDCDRPFTNVQTSETASSSTTGGLAATACIPLEVLATPPTQILINVLPHEQVQDDDDDVQTGKQQRFYDTSTPLLHSPGKELQPAFNCPYSFEVSGYMDSLLIGQRRLISNSRQHLEVLQSLHQLMNEQAPSGGNINQRANDELRLMRECMQEQATAICSTTERTNAELSQMRESLTVLVNSNTVLAHATNTTILENHNIAKELLQCTQNIQQTNPQLVELFEQQRQAIEVIALHVSEGSTVPSTSALRSQTTRSSRRRRHPTCSLCNPPRPGRGSKRKRK